MACGRFRCLVYSTPSRRQAGGPADAGLRDLGLGQGHAWAWLTPGLLRAGMEGLMGPGIKPQGAQ